ncbi:glycosyl hydrolase [Leucobacter sp. Psy1]|uniref:glycosyltransferase family A protein n=1 Tax=Leucobacter sp. Psy1 TaxID=2875729 RepID=UPI001CD2B60B|nr:glycosyltransferase family A protein [Leucobacter sp. Psy1]UBH06404.1 glycosyl hydrolase [Leucobacter sp. Psy1]
MERTGEVSVSVVIPVKDDAALLERCLTALAEQHRAADEVIVVDNGSVDDSVAVAKQWGARVVPCAKRGIAAASAAGYDAAVGGVVLRLDADCVPSPDWVRTMVLALGDDPETAVVSGGARFIDGPRLLRGVLAAAYLGAYTAATLPALGHRPVFGSNLGFRRSVWLEARGRVHAARWVHDDLDLAFHFGERTRIGVVDGNVMGMSMRPFSHPGAFARRVARGVRTVLTHWPRDFPPVRWVHLAVRQQLRRGKRS